MKLSALKKLFSSVQIERALEFHEVNPLMVAENIEFERKERGSTKTFRDRALDFILKQKVPFTTTGNGPYECFQRFVKVSCPHCDGTTKVTQGGGSGSSYSVQYRCENTECGTEVSIHTGFDGLSVRPKE